MNDSSLSSHSVGEKDKSENEKTKGLTLIPLSLYNKGKNIKVSFVVAKGKKKTDKRQVIMKREADRDIHRTLKKLR